MHKNSYTNHKLFYVCLYIYTYLCIHTFVSLLAYKFKPIRQYARISTKKNTAFRKLNQLFKSYDRHMKKPNKYSVLRRNGDAHNRWHTISAHAVVEEKYLLLILLL